ncbi:hypothetical protein GYH30_003788 [Glycine max]|uniref:HMA domain-containing protein n=1 Tax=Glycine max TaxID=3847 RepID=K7K7X1_SOYBN|nr:hypothetical protein JHK87_003765 [Glycine soja]KAH1059971.1 hypothetical protein GYH30_003788 [Glycine max]
MEAEAENNDLKKEENNNDNNNNNNESNRKIGNSRVEEVTADSKASKVVVKGKAADPMKVCERLQKKSGKKVELISPLPKPPEENKEEEITTTRGEKGGGYSTFNIGAYITNDVKTHRLFNI